MVGWANVDRDAQVSVPVDAVERQNQRATTALDMKSIEKPPFCPVLR
jgi:hypothetical protein